MASTVNKPQELKQDITTITNPDKATLNTLNKELLDLFHHEAKYTINDNGSVTFYPTPNITTTQKKLNKKKMSFDSTIKNSGCTKVEATSDTNIEIIEGSDASICSFIKAALDAWSNHYPFRFKVEHIWLLILQSLAVHIDQNAEKLRNKYVIHNDKKTLQIIRNDFVLGSDKNKWDQVIQEFAEQINVNTVKDVSKLFECDFTSSSFMQQICSKITLMDICQKYFKYLVSTRCGFPQITLDGTQQDWIKLKDKVVEILTNKVDTKFGEEWGAALLPLLDRFIIAFDGDIDCVFWNSMIKRGAVCGSGGFSFYSGWFNILFPFLMERRNSYCVPYSMDKAYVDQGFALHRRIGWGHEAGGHIQKYPSGLAKVGVTWDYYGKILELKFIAGFVGYTQDVNTLEICPNLGWCIAHQTMKNEKK